MRLKDAAFVNRRDLADTVDPAFSFKYVDISAIDEFGTISVPGDEMRFGQAPSRARRLAPPGSTVISTVRTYLRAIARVPRTSDPLVFSTGFAVLEPKSDIDGRFLAYLCRSSEVVREIVARSVGVSYPAINPGDLSSIHVTIPALDEQRRIADFLDRELDRIDKLAAVRGNHRALLDERATNSLVASLIAEEGSSWRRSRLKYLFRSARNGVWGDEPTGAAEDVICVRVADFDRNCFLAGRAASTTRSVPVDIARDHLLRPGDVLLEKSGGGERSPVGFAVTFDGSNRSVCSNFVAALRVVDDAHPRFAALLLAAYYRSGRNVPFIKQATGIQNLDGGGYLAQEARLPGLADQISIAGQIDRELEQLSTVRTSIDRQLALLAERRENLITAAVTGQIDITTSRGADV